ncbi:MAG TPA: NADH-quinone oxidoreductase subunit J [Acidimicrobiia bacterium]|nr:NADH-quinone oxidoreductase subunit J [Acidimicrobiia bacterium]
MEWAVFAVFAVAALSGAVGVVLARKPVHAALCLVLTLFCVAVFFVLQEAHFLAAVQVIVYAGAIVILFLFVIMLLGVDEADDLFDEPLRGQRPLAVASGIALLAGLLLLGRTLEPTGASSSRGPALGDDMSNVERVARSLFTDFLWPFEITSVLLVIAVVGAVVLARRGRAAPPSGGEPEASTWEDDAVEVDQ